MTKDQEGRAVAVTPQPSQGLSDPQLRMKLRGDLAVEVTVVLSPFYLDVETPERIRVGEMKVWLDVLDGVTAQEFRAAWVVYMKGNPPRTRAGYLIKPDAGVVYQQVMALRRAAMPPRPPTRPEPPRAAPVTKEAAARIMREVWGDQVDGDGAIYAPKTFPKVGQGKT